LDSAQLCALFTLACLLLVYGFFSGAQGALFALKEEDLEGGGKTDDRRSRRLQALLLSPKQTSLSLLVGQRLALLGCVISGCWAWIAFGGSVHPLALLAALPPLAIVVSSVAFVRPFRRTPLLYAYRLATPLWVFHKLIGPVRWALQRCTEGLLSLWGASSPSAEEELLEREYLGLVEMGHREGVLESEERRLIHRVFEFGDQPVSRVMTPRMDMFSLPLEMDLQEVVHQVRESGFSRIPVHRQQRDDVVGILYAKDLLRLRLPGESDRPFSLSQLLHEPYFVPTHMAIDELFKEFQRRKLHMAICVDEYGGIAGLVTMEDLLEELFGEIYDEYDLETRHWESMGEGAYLVSGRMELDELQALIHEEIQEPHCQTVAGLVLNLLGHVPRRGEEIRRGRYRFVVEKVTGTRIQSVRVERVEEEAS
jgi:CBS domain containing-hemolysin-like protein